MTSPSLEQTQEIAAQAVRRGIRLGRINIDFNSPGFQFDGYFRKLLVIDGETVADKLFGPETHRNYNSETEFRAAIRAAVESSELMQGLASGMTQDPSLIVDLIGVLVYGLYQQDLSAEPEVIEWPIPAS